MDCGIYYPGLNFDPPLTASQMLFFVGGFAGLCMLFAYGFRKTRAVFSGVRRIAGMVLSVGMILLLALLLFFLLDFDLAFFAGSALVMCIAVWSLYRPCARLSDRGDRMDTEMRGLEMYIRTAEKHRLAKINAPEDTVEKYEEFLPYAAALNCAEAWQKRFDPLLARLNYVPDWIDEPGTQEVFTPKRVSRIIRTVAGPSAMTRAVSAAGAAAYAAATSGYAGTGSIVFFFFRIQRRFIRRRIRRRWRRRMVIRPEKNPFPGVHRVSAVLPPSCDQTPSSGPGG